MNDMSVPKAAAADAPVSAFNALKTALQADEDYAWSWHCNLAMPIMDSIRCSPTDANKAGADLMRYLFDIDIRKHSHWNHDAPAQPAGALPALPEGFNGIASIDDPASVAAAAKYIASTMQNYTAPQETSVEQADVEACAIGDYGPIDSRRMACVFFNGRKVAECYTNEDAKMVAGALAPQPSAPASAQQAYSLDDFFRDADARGWTAAKLARALKDRPEFADCSSAQPAGALPAQGQYHAPGIGEVHDAAHSVIAYAVKSNEVGEEVPDDKLAGQIAGLLNGAAREATKAEPVGYALADHLGIVAGWHTVYKRPWGKYNVPLYAAPPDADSVRRAPDLLSEEERASLLKKAEALWAALLRNNLGGYSGINRPFYILSVFKNVIETFGHRDIGLTWSNDDLDALAAKPATEPVDPLPNFGP